MKKFNTFLLFAFAFLLSSGSALAVDVPSFPSCQSFGGVPKVSYNSGIHGIVGNSGQYVGSDTVYSVGDSNLIQCFCSQSGSGIQTNWWKQSSLTENQINTLKNLGWIFVPSGEPWGLEDAPYFAQNSNFSCGSSSYSPPGDAHAPTCDSAKPGTPTLISANRNGSSATLSWTPVSTATHYTIGYGTKANEYIFGVANTGNVTTYTINALDPNATYYFAVKAVNNCTPGDWSGNTNSYTGGQVLGLASTGTILQILAAATLSVIFFGLALYVRKTSTN